MVKEGLLFILEISLSPVLIKEIGIKSGSEQSELFSLELGNFLFKILSAVISYYQVQYHVCSIDSLSII